MIKQSIFPAHKNRKIFFFTFLFITLAIIAAMIPMIAHAQDRDNAVLVKPRAVADNAEYKPHAGLLAGYADPEGSYRSGAEYGITVGYQPYIPFGLGLELSTTQNDVTTGPTEFDFRRTKLLVQGTYNFGGAIPVISHSYIGLAIGPMLESTTGSDELVFGTMPTLGFDYPIATNNGKDITLGLNARYLISSSGVPDAFGLNAMAKYWF